MITGNDAGNTKKKEDEEKRESKENYLTLKDARKENQKAKTKEREGKKSKNSFPKIQNDTTRVSQTTHLTTHLPRSHHYITVSALNAPLKRLQHANSHDTWRTSS